MNFHKTIGFLATLLLTLGIGVPDSFAQDPTVKSVALSVNKMSFLDTDDGTAVSLTATVTMSKKTTAATTVSVALVDSTATSVGVNMRAEPGDYSLSNLDLTAGSETAIGVVIPKGATTGSKMLNFIFDPATDAADLADEMVAISAVTNPGNKTDVVTLTIADTDNAVSMVALSVNKMSFLDTDDGTPVILTASVTMKADAASETTVTVILVDSTATSVGVNMQAEPEDYSLSGLTFDTTDIEMVVAKGSRTASKTLEFILDPDEDTDDTVDEMVAIGGVATPGNKTDVVKLTITDTDNSVSMVELSADNTSFMDTDEDMPVVLTATVTMKKNAAAATTVTVTLVDSTATSVGVNMRAEPGDYSLSNLDLTTGSETAIEVIVAKGSMTGTKTHSFILDPDEDTDDTVDEMVAIGAVTDPGNKTDVVKLTITDTDNSVSMVELSADNTSFKDTDDGMPVVLTAMVTMKKNAAAATTVIVTLVDSTATSVKKAADRAEPEDYSLSNLDLATGSETAIEVIVAKGSMTGTKTHSFIFTPATDGDSTTPETADEMVAIGAVTDPGNKTDVVTLTITDTDRPVPGAVTGLTLSPEMFSLTEGTAFTGTVTVTLTVEAGAATSHTVEWAAGGAALDALGITSSTAVAIKANATSGMATIDLSYTPMEDDDTDGETVVITGSVGDQSDSVTLNIADNDMGAVTGLTLSPATLSLTEGMAFTETITVTVQAVAGPAATHSVNLSSSLPTGSIATPVAVSIDQDATSGMATVELSYTPMEDDDTADETMTITGSVGGQSATVTLNVADNDMGAVTSLTLSPDMFSLTEGTAFTGTVTVTVNVAAGAATTHTVEWSAGGAGLADLGITSSTAVTIVQGATSGMATIDLSYTPMPDTDLDDETITITGSAGGQSDSVTLNVADNTPSAGTIKVSTSLESIRENSRTRNVVVTATLPSAPGTGNTVVVNVEVRGGTAPVTTSIPISGTATSGTATVAITPVNDEVFTTRSFTVTGSVTGYRSGTAKIDIVDDDASMGTLSFSAISPPSATLNGGAQNLTLTVKVWLASPDTPIPNPLVVNVATSKGTLASQTVSITNIRKHPDHDPATRKADGSGTVVLSLAAGDVNAAGEITVTASADRYEMGTRTIPIRARGALDVAGYRAVISKPTGTAWANVGNDKIFVDVTRYANVAYPWGDFGSIKVSVRDTAHGVHEIEAVTARGFNREDDGAVTFEEPASTSRGDVIWRGNDTIRFEIRIRPYDANRDPAANGQYLGAYGHVEFTSGRETASIETRDDATSVYPADASLVNNAKVGDGRLVRIDNQLPGHSGVEAVVVTSGDEVGSGIDATVGDEIRVAVKVSRTNLFRESGLRIQLQVVDGTGSVNGQTLTAAQRNAPSKNKDFSPSQVIAASNDSLIHTYKVTEGFFTITLDDFVEGVGAKATKLDLNNARARVRAGVKDQAANFKFSGWTTFGIDSRSPSVSILYPSADPDSIYEHTHPMRFSGAVKSIVEGQNVDAHLNPLAILVDEDLSALKVYAVGADTLDIFKQILSNVIGDSMAVYDTSTLSSPKKDADDDYENTEFVPSSANRAGTAIELAVLATDKLGNTTKTTISGVTHDASPPVITDWFPKNSLLPEDQINDATPPVFTLSEDVDSIAVTFQGSDGSEVVKQRGGVTTKGEDSIDFSGALKDEISYDMMIFVRDLAGNVFITPADSSSNMKFNAEFDNPVANRFKISTETDSVIAGQANMLTLQAEDHDSGSNVTRNALTYKNAVRISAWDTGGGAAESVWFEGTGVTDDADSPDGVAMLSAADWRIGKRTVTAKSNMAVGHVKILVQHVTSGQGDTAVLGFESAKDSLYVGAADFAGFDITAWEEGADGAVQDIWGNYTLRVVPVDRHGNASVRAFKADPAGDDADSLDVLDTRVKDNAFEYKNGIDVEIIGVPTIEDFALLILSVEKEGANYDLVAPDDRRTQTVQVRVVNGSLKEGDSRSQNIRSSAKFNISAPLTPVLTLWVPGSDKDEAGNDVVIPADPGDITVTVAAEGYNAGDMVTFTRNGTAMDPVRANDDGVAKLMITASMASTTTVSATNGRYSADELTITFVDTPPEPARKSYVDANGDPVYLIYAGDAPPDMMVGVDDFLALVAAFGSSDGDDNYNAQADVDDSGMVDVADFLEFITSFGRTAAGPATKPLVLAPGINENAEFSLSLGSERVVAGELVAVDVSLANVAALIGYGFALNYETDKFEFVSVAPADEDLLKSTGGETLFHHIVSDGQVTVANGLYNGTAVSGGGDVVRFVFRVLREFEDNARFEIADGLVFDPSQLQNPAVVAGVLELQSTPREFALHQNFPNPFNPDTTIKYDLAESADVTLQIYNVLGQVVRTLVASEAQNAGRYQIRWNGMDDRGVPVSSGIYFYQISADGKFSDVRKLMLLK